MERVETLNSFLEKARRNLKWANPVGVTLQAYLESGGYSSELAREAHNFCGIKAKGDWKGEVYEKLSDEDEGGEKMVARRSPFRKYGSTELFLMDLDRKIQRKNYEKCHSLEGRWNFWVYFSGLVEGGWATDRKYFKKLVDVAVAQMRNIEGLETSWRSKLHISFQWAVSSDLLEEDQVTVIAEALEGV